MSPFILCTQVALALALRAPHRSVQRLHCHTNYATDEAAYAMLRALRDNGSLRVVDLHANPIRPVLVERLDALCASRRDVTGLQARLSRKALSLANMVGAERRRMPPLLQRPESVVADDVLHHATRRQLRITTPPHDTITRNNSDVRARSAESLMSKSDSQQSSVILQVCAA